MQKLIPIKNECRIAESKNVLILPNTIEDFINKFRNSRLLYKGFNFRGQKAKGK